MPHIQMRAKLGSAVAVIRVGASRTFDVATAKAKEIIKAIQQADHGDEERISSEGN